jgi:hypothetical protein
MIYTRKKIRKVRGGAVSYLDPSQYGITSPVDIKKMVELLSISSHGETTNDGKFIIVPPKTYLMFLSHSGEPAEGENPIEAVYYGYKNANGENTYYERIYKHIFKPYSERKENGLNLPSEELYIYQPGDIIPDYKLSFNNSDLFMFMHGIYKLPIQKISGKGKDAAAYVGRPLRYIRELYKNGDITLEELNELNDRDRQIVLNDKFTNNQMDDYRIGVITTPFWSLTKLRKKIETLCCSGDDNLLFSNSFNQQMFKENLNRVRLSTILKMLPRDSTKRMRFMLMNFCRVSYADTVRDYAGSKIVYPRLIRSLSFSGKCTTETKESAFNIYNIYILFCSLIQPIKQKMLKEDDIRRLIKLLKKVLTPSTGTFDGWKKCLEPGYVALTGSERVDLIQNYVGYLTTDEMLELSDFYNILSKLRSKEKHPKMKAAYDLLIKPFKTLNDQLKVQTETIKEKVDLKKAGIKGVYSYLKDTFDPLVISNSDFLKLQFTSDSNILELLKSLRGDELNKELESIRDKRLKYLKEKNQPIMDDGWLEGQLEGVFEEYLGEEEESYITHIEPFQNVTIIDDSISFNDLSNSNDNNTNNNSNNTQTKRGGLRKTRKNKYRKY